jgi:hypothetical protein
MSNCLRQRSAFHAIACGTLVLLLSITAAAFLWSWWHPVSVRLGPYWIGFGRTYTLGGKAPPAGLYAHFHKNGTSSVGLSTSRATWDILWQTSEAQPAVVPAQDLHKVRLMFW